MFWKNFARELTHNISRLLSVIIIVAVAVMMTVGLNGITSNIHRIVDEYFDQQNVADYWITGLNFDRADVNSLKRIEGVTGVQPRIVLDAEARHDENITLKLYGIADGYSINTPLITQGNFPRDEREIMISQAFAEKQGLNVGDFYEMKLQGTDTVLYKQICALVRSPECLHHVSPTLFMPDYSKYGFAYMNEEALSGVLGKNLYNQICLTTEDGTSDAAIKQSIDAVLSSKVVNVLALPDNASAYSIITEIDGIAPIITMFPLIFFLVAVLIMFSTMSRLIETSRMSIGTFKALGYRDKAILKYYLQYAAIVVVLGFVIGIIPATSVLTKVLANTFFSMVDVPSYRLLPDVSSMLSAFLLTAVFCLGTSYLVTVRALQEKPVDCMRPKPPKQVKRIFLERWPSLWHALSFSQKYIVRNIFRNKTRMAICIVGVAGCMTLILTSFAISNSVDGYLDKMSGNQHKYDVVLYLRPDASMAQYDHIRKMSGVESVQSEMLTNAKVYTQDRQETTALTVTEDVISLKLLSATGPRAVALPTNGVVMDKDIADKLVLRVGDMATFKFTDKNAYYRLPIAEIMPSINGVCASKSYWRSENREFVPTTLYVKTSDAPGLISAISHYDFVASYDTQAMVIHAMAEQVSSLSMIVYILIAFGAVLEMVVLYNLGIMSFYEQIRNLATLLVLGFHDKETRKLLLSENIVFTAIGILIGIPLGLLLSGLVLGNITLFPFVLVVNPVSFVISALVTLVFALIVNAMIGKKMVSIDMLGALKSIE